MSKMYSGLSGFIPSTVTNGPGGVRSEGHQDTSSCTADIDPTRPPLPVEFTEVSSQLIERCGITITGGEIDWVEATTRFLVWQGHPIKKARAIADVAIALAELDIKRVGRKRSAPHLYLRGSYIWRTDGEKRLTTGFRAIEGKDYKKHVGANAKLGEMVEKRVRRILGRVLKKDVTVSEMFVEYLRNHRPGRRPDALDKERYDDIANHLDHLEKFMGKNTLNDLGENSGLQYADHAVAQQIKSQSVHADPAEIRFIARTTARDHVATLMKVLRWYFRQHGIDPITIKKPKADRPAVGYLTVDEIMRLISAARGRIFDESGKIIGHHDNRARYECVVRFILIYIYGGTRHANILWLTWGQDFLTGHINPDLGIIERQGGLADITSKRRGTSWLVGSLVELSARWHDEDEAMRKLFPGRYTHIIHDEEGFPIAKATLHKPSSAGHRMSHLFREVRELAGLKHARPHMLKHSGVTYAVRAGMPIGAVEQAFSTSFITLWTYYAHLRPHFNTGIAYDPSRLKLLAMRRLSSRSKSSLGA